MLRAEDMADGMLGGVPAGGGGLLRGMGPKPPGRGGGGLDARLGFGLLATDVPRPPVLAGDRENFGVFPPVGDPVGSPGLAPTEGPRGLAASGGGAAAVGVDEIPFV